MHDYLLLCFRKFEIDDNVCFWQNRGFSTGQALLLRGKNRCAKNKGLSKKALEKSLEFFRKKGPAPGL